MAKGGRDIPPCSKTYGLPLYGAACVPIDRIANHERVQEEEEQDRKREQQDEPSPPSNSDRIIIAVAGGGGEGGSGVLNALVISAFDFDTRSISDHPICRLGTEEELPYRMAVHPGGDGLVCSFTNSCRWFEWDYPESKEPNKLALKSSEKILAKLENVGQQLALTFNAEGSLFATGGQDGHIRIFKWPSLEIILDQPNAHTSVKDLDFSSDAMHLVSLGSGGPCRVWDLKSLTAVANLQREDGEMFGFCRFYKSSGENKLLYITAMHGLYGSVISWNVDSGKRVRSKKIVHDSISAFNISSDGKFLAIGTTEGTIVILNSSNLQLLTTVKKAHLGPVTALVFSLDSRAVVSTSFDSTVRVTLIDGKKKNGLNVGLVVLMILLSILVYFINFQRNP